MGKKNHTLVTREERLYGYFSALWMSFYSQNLYIDVGKRWRGFGLLYLLLLSALVAIPWSVQTGLTLQKDYVERVLPSIQKMPVIHYIKGKLSIDKEMPYIINDPATNKPVVIIDDTGKYTSLKNSPATVLMTSNQIFTQFKYSGTDVDTIGPELTFDLTPKLILTQVERGKRLLFYVLYPTVVSILYATEITLLLVLAALGQFVTRVFTKYPLKYRQSMRLICVAATPQLSLVIVTLLVDWTGSLASTVVSLSLIAYYAFGVRANKRFGSQMVVA